MIKIGNVSSQNTAADPAKDKKGTVKQPEITALMQDEELVQASLKASNETGEIIGEFLNTIKTGKKKDSIETGKKTDKNKNTVNTEKMKDGTYKITVTNSKGKILSETFLSNKGVRAKEITYGTNGKIVTTYDSKGKKPTKTDTYMKVNGKYQKYAKTSITYSNGTPTGIKKFNGSNGKELRNGTIKKDTDGNTVYTFKDTKTGQLQHEFTFNSKGENIKKISYTNYGKDTNGNQTRKMRVSENGKTVTYNQTLDKNGNVLEEINKTKPNVGAKNTYEYTYDKNNKILSTVVNKYDKDNNLTSKEEINNRTNEKVVYEYVDGTEIKKEVDSLGRVVKESATPGKDVTTYTYKGNTKTLESKLVTSYIDDDKTEASSCFEYHYNQKVPGVEGNDTTIRKFYYPDFPGYEETEYLALDSEGNENWLTANNYFTYRSLKAGFDAGYKEGRVTEEEYKKLIDASVNISNIMGDSEILELANKARYGTRPNDTFLDSQIQSIKERFGDIEEIYFDFNIISEEYAKQEGINTDGMIVLSQDRIDCIIEALETLKNHGTELPKQLFITDFCESAGTFLPRCETREDAIFIRSRSLASKDFDAENYKGILYHENGHKNDYKQGVGTNFASSVEYDPNNPDILNVKFQKPNIGIEDITGTISRNALENLIGYYALYNNQEFIAEVTMWITWDFIVYDEEANRFTINADKITDQEEFSFAEGTGKGYASAGGHVAKWDGTEEDHKNLATIMNIYNYLMSQNGDLDPIVVPSLQSGGKISSMTKEEYLKLIKSE